MVDNSSCREIIVRVLDVRNLDKPKQDLYSLVGITNTDTSFSHRPYHSKADTWGTSRSLFDKIIETEEANIKIEIYSKEKLGHVIVPVNQKKSLDGVQTTNWYPLDPIGQVQVSFAWSTVEVKVKGRSDLIASVYGPRPLDLLELDYAIPRHERPFWKEYLSSAEKMLGEGLVLPPNVILSVLKGSLESVTKKNVVRVFTSSTFTDTETERNRLMADVYPYLSLLCKKIGLEFETVDMRWGVREFTNDNHQTSELCMKELHKCLNLSVGPAFMCLLGNKYGYRPFPAKITQDILETMWAKICEVELAPLLPEHKSLVDKLSSSKVESVLGKLSDAEKTLVSSTSELLYIPTWFRLDQNSKPAVYDLQNITTLLPAFRSPVAAERNQASSQWWKIFESIQLLLRKGATVLNKEEQIKFIISVTNEEIFHGILNNSNYKDQAVCIARRITDGESIHEDRELRKFIDSSFTSSVPLASFPTASSTTATSALTLDCEATSLLSHLKQNVSDIMPPGSLLDYVVTTKHLGTEKDDKSETKDTMERYLREVCEVVCKSLGDHIVDGFRKSNLATSVIFKEVTHHHEFLKVKLRGYVGRDKLQDTILDYCKKEEEKNHALIVYAESGAGKTALMAWVAHKVHLLHPSASVITRFLGTTPASSDVLLLTRGICAQLMAILDNETPETEEVAKNGNSEEVNALLKALIQLSATKGEQVFLFIDSVDQLLPNNNAYLLDWLPIELPKNVHLVVSVLIPSKEEEANPTLTKSRIPNLYARLRILYEPVPSSEAFFVHIPQLMPSEAEQIIDSRLNVQDTNGWSRALTTEQKAIVLKNTGSSFTPLYLCIALDLAVQWKSYTPLSECTLAGTTRDIILQLFRKLETVHGKVLVSHALGYLTASRYGLSSPDLEDILSCDDEVLNDVYQWWVPPIRRLPPLLWKRLKEDLSGYLVDKGVGNVTLSSWFHRQFKEAAEDVYLSGDDFMARYRTLAKYFDGTLGNENRLVAPQPLHYSETKLNHLKISSLPYHQAFCLEPAQFESSLYNLEFIEYKIRAEMSGDLIRDFDFAIHLLQRNPEFRQQFSDHITKLKNIQDFLRGNLNILLQNPSMILMLALNQPDGSPVHTLAMQQRGKDLYAGRKILQLINKEEPLSGVLTMESTETVDSVHFEHDEERIMAHYSNSIKVWDVTTGLELQVILKDSAASSALPGERIICTQQGSTKIFDSRNGVEISTLKGSDIIEVRAYAGSPDKQTIILLGRNNGIAAVQVWNYIKLELVHTLPAPAVLTYARFTFDGKKVLCSGPGAEIVEVYDPYTAKLIQRLEHPKEVHFCEFSSDGAYVYSAGYDGTVYVWDIEKGTQEAPVKAHANAIRHISVSPVGKRIATASVDKTIKIWDSTSPDLKELFQLKGHRDLVQKVFFSKDGKKLLSISDTIVMVWDAIEGKEITTLQGHSARVFSCCFSEDYQKVLTGSIDRTVRLWDLSARTQAKESHHHTKEISQVTYSPDGKFMVTASYDQTLKVWDPLGKLLVTIPQDRNWEPNFALSPTGEFIMTVLKKTVVVFNTLTGEAVHVLKAHTRELYYCIFSSSGLFATFSDKEAKLWDPKTWKELKKFAGHDEEIHRITFSPDSTLFVTVSTDTLAVWNVKTGKKIHDLGGPDIKLKSLEYTSDGKYLVGSLGNDISQWLFTPSPEVSTLGVEGMVQLGVPPNDPNLIVCSKGDLTLGLFGSDLEKRELPFHRHKSLPRFIFNKDELWSYAYNELVLWHIKNGDIKKDTQFFIPKLITSLARHGNLIACGTAEGTLYNFVIQ